MVLGGGAFSFNLIKLKAVHGDIYTVREHILCYRYKNTLSYNMYKGHRLFKRSQLHPVQRKRHAISNQPTNQTCLCVHFTCTHTMCVVPCAVVPVACIVRIPFPHGKWHTRCDKLLASVSPPSICCSIGPITFAHWPSIGPVHCYHGTISPV